MKINPVPPPPGGDLHYHLSQHGVFSEKEMRFYATEIILGLEHMHHRFVVYRDLKVSCAAGSPVAGSARGDVWSRRWDIPDVFLTQPRHPCDVGLSRTPNSVLGARVCPSGQSPRCLLQCLAQLGRSFQNFNGLIREKQG